MSAGRNLIAYGAVAVVVAAVVGGVMLIGSPSSQRILRFDEQRVSNLRSLSSAIEIFAARHAALPQDLDALLADPTVYAQSTRDPETGSPYAYRIINAQSYELCAEFGAASADATYVPDGFRHPEGHHCFTFTIPGKPSPG